MPSDKKSPVWKYFLGSDQRMTCLLCQQALTSRTGKFLASNLERHLRTKHVNTDTYRQFQRDKSQWTEECGRVRISHIISLPSTKKPRAPVENEAERKKRRRESLKESQKRHRLRKKVILDSVQTDVLQPSAYCDPVGATTDVRDYAAVGLQQSIISEFFANSQPGCSAYEAEDPYGHISSAASVQYLLTSPPTQTESLYEQVTDGPGGSFNGDVIDRCFIAANAKADNRKRPYAVLASEKHPSVGRYSKSASLGAARRLVAKYRRLNSTRLLAHAHLAVLSHPLASPSNMLVLVSKWWDISQNVSDMGSRRIEEHVNFTGVYTFSTYILPHRKEVMFLKQYASQWWDLLTTALVMKDADPQCNRLAHMIAYFIGRVLDGAFGVEVGSDAPQLCSCRVDARFADPGVHFTIPGICNRLTTENVLLAFLLVEELKDVWKDVTKSPLAEVADSLTFVLRHTASLTVEPGAIKKIKNLYPFWTNVIDCHRSQLPRQYCRTLVFGEKIGIACYRPFPVEASSNSLFRGQFWKPIAEEEISEFAFAEVFLQIDIDTALIVKRLSYVQNIRTHRLVVVGSKEDVERKLRLLQEIVSTMEYYDEVDYIQDIHSHAHPTEGPKSLSTLSELRKAMDTSDLDFKDEANLIFGIFKEAVPDRRFEFVWVATNDFVFAEHLTTDDQRRRAQYLIWFILHLGINADERLPVGADDLLSNFCLQLCMQLDTRCDPANSFDLFTPVALLANDCSNWASNVTMWLLCELFTLVLGEDNAGRRFASAALLKLTLTRVLPFRAAFQTTQWAWLSFWLESLLPEIQLALSQADAVDSPTVARSIVAQFAGSHSPLSCLMMDQIRDLDHNGVMALMSSFVEFWHILWQELRIQRLMRLIENDDRSYVSMNKMTDDTLKNIACFLKRGEIEGIRFVSKRFMTVLSLDDASYPLRAVTLEVTRFSEYLACCLLYEADDSSCERKSHKFLGNGNKFWFLIDMTKDPNGKTSSEIARRGCWIKNIKTVKYKVDKVDLALSCLLSCFAVEKTIQLWITECPAFDELCLTVILKSMPNVESLELHCEETIEKSSDESFCDALLLLRTTSITSIRYSAATPAKLCTEDDCYSILRFIFDTPVNIDERTLDAKDGATVDELFFDSIITVGLYVEVDHDIWLDIGYGGDQFRLPDTEEPFIQMDIWTGRTRPNNQSSGFREKPFHALYFFRHVPSPFVVMLTENRLHYSVTKEQRLTDLPDMLMMDDLSRRLRDMEPFAKDTLLTPSDRPPCEDRPGDAEMETENVDVEPPGATPTQRQLDNEMLAKCGVVIKRNVRRIVDIFDVSVYLYCMCKPTAFHEARKFSVTASLSTLCSAVTCAVHGFCIVRFVVKGAEVDDTMVLLFSTIEQRLEGDVELVRCHVSDTSALHRLVKSGGTIASLTLRDCHYEYALCVDDSLLLICAKVGVKEVTIKGRSSETSITNDGVISFLFHAARTVRDDLRLASVESIVANNAYLSIFLPGLLRRTAESMFPDRHNEAAGLPSLGIFGRSEAVPFEAEITSSKLIFQRGRDQPVVCVAPLIGRHALFHEHSFRDKIIWVLYQRITPQVVDDLTPESRSDAVQVDRMMLSTIKSFSEFVEDAASDPPGSTSDKALSNQSHAAPDPPVRTSSLSNEAENFASVKHYYYQMNLLMGVELEMLDTMIVNELQDTDHAVVKYLLTYFACIASAKAHPVRCAVAAPEYTHEIFREMLRSCSDEPTVQQRECAFSIITGCRDNYEYLLVPFIGWGHWMLLVGDMSTGMFTFYDPLQPREDLDGVRRTVVLTVHELISDLQRKGENVPFEGVTCADYSNFVRQGSDHNCGIHISLIAESFLLRSGDESRTRLEGLNYMAERRRYRKLLLRIRDGHIPRYVGPRASTFTGSRMASATIDGFEEATAAVP